MSEVDTGSRVLGTRLRQFGVVVVAAKVALLPLVFDPSLDMPFPVAKAVVSHGLAYVLVALIACLLITFGRSSFVWSCLHLPVAAFLLANVMAAAFAIDPIVALYGTHARMLGLGTTADMVVLYFALVLFVRTRADAFAVALSALTASAVVLMYEGIQLAGRDPFQWSVDTSERPFATLGQATTLAEYLTVLAIGVFALALFVGQLRRRWRLVMLAYTFVLVIAAAATGTRSALIGLATGAAAFLVLIWLGQPSRRVRVGSLVGALGASVALAGLAVFSPLGARLADTLDVPIVDSADDELLARLAPSAAARVAFFQIGAGILRERPLLGFGPDNFVAGVPRFRPEPAPYYVRQSLATSAHSWLVHVAASSGLLGLGCFLAIVLGALTLAARRASNPVVMASAAMLCAFLGSGLTTINEIGTEWLFWACTGAIAAATAPIRAISTPHSRLAKPADGLMLLRQRVVPALVPAVCVLAILTGMNTLEASRSARASDDSRLVGKGAAAIDLGLRATRADPGRAKYWHTLGFAYIASARWTDALSALTRASALTPYDASYIGDVARVQLIRLGDGVVSARTEALQLAERAVLVDPNNPRAHHTRAIVMQAVGDVPEAVRSIERALVLDPGSTNEQLYLTASQVFLAAGRPAEAIGVAREGLTILGHTRRTIGIIVELARALASSGQTAEALSELDLALSIQPGEPGAQRLRDQIRSGSTN